MAVLAVLVATVSLLGHRTHTEEIILQNQVTDKWAAAPRSSATCKTN